MSYDIKDRLDFAEERDATSHDEPSGTTMATRATGFDDSRMHGSSTSVSLSQLATALAKAQAVIRPAAKTAVNPHYRSRYADLAAIWEACRDALTKNGFAVVQMPGFDPATGCVSVTTRLLHSSGEFIESTARAPIAKSDAQAVGSALTYLRRYSLAAFVGVAPDDDDGEAATRVPAGNARDAVQESAPPVPVWPFGERKGTLLRDLSDQELTSGRDWCVKKDEQKFAELIKQVDQELRRRESTP